MSKIFVFAANFFEIFFSGNFFAEKFFFVEIFFTVFFLLRKIFFLGNLLYSIIYNLSIIYFF